MSQEPAIPFLNIYLRTENKCSQKDLHINVWSNLLRTAKNFKKSKFLPIKEDISKLWYSQKTEWYSSIQRNKIWTQQQNV